MKTFINISIVFLLVLPYSYSQELFLTQQVIDTIYANDHKNVALFFPDPIKQGITGSQDFIFTYNRERQQHLGLLQATPGKESNLLVISNSGLVFSYIVKYSEQLKKLNYFISETGSIGNENPKLINKKLVENENSEQSAVHSLANFFSEKEEHFKKISSKLLRSNEKIKVHSKTNDGITFKVQNIFFQGEELFFVMEIVNKSPVDYEVNYLNISIGTRQKGKRKSLQKLAQEPIFRFLNPIEIPRGKISRFVYVLPKFSIASDKAVILDLKELNGERDIKLKLNSKIINNPN